MPTSFIASTMTPPLCSICIANYNGLDIIAECVDAVLAQEPGFSFEILIHDDASTDGSVAYIRQRYPEIQIIVSENNVGFCVSNNRMAAAAQGQYILLLNNDAILLPNALRTLHDHARQQAAPGILGLPQYDAGTGALLDMGSLSDPFLNSIPNLDPQQTEVAMIAGACMWVPADLWRRLGGFPEWFHTLAEDTYLCCAARVQGYPVQVIPHSGFRHWVGKSLGGGKLTAENKLSTSRQRRALTERNKIFAIYACYPSLCLWLILPPHILLVHIEGALLALLKRDAGIWKDIYAPLLPSIWRMRKLLASSRNIIQAQRKIGAWQFLAPFHFSPHKLTMLFRYGLPHIK